MIEPRWLFDVVSRIDRERAAVCVEARDASEDPGAVPGTTLFVASTDTPDRAMDVVSQSSWRLANFRANPVILDNHDPRRVVGHAVDVKVPRTGDDAGRLMIRVKWDLESPDPSIRNVGHQHLSGIRRAGSVGFKAAKKTARNKLPTDHPHYQEPIEVETWWGTETVAGTLYEGNELLEFSSATIPMNSEALQRSLLRADPPAEDPAADAEAELPEFVRLLTDDAAIRSAVLDALWPDAMGRLAASLGDGPADPPADEPPPMKAFRAAIHRVLRETATRRILTAALAATPPQEPFDFAGAVLRALESP